MTAKEKRMTDRKVRTTNKGKRMTDRKVRTTNKGSRNDGREENAGMIEAFADKSFRNENF